MTATTEPTTITPGDTVQWTRTLADYPASAGWVLSYEFVNASARFAITASASGDNHAVSVPATTSDDYAAGWYDWRGKVTKAGEVHTIATGRTQVLPSFGAAVDARSTARRMLAAVEAVLEGKAAADVQEYQVQGRQLKKYTFDELLRLRSALMAECAREDAATAAAAGQPDRRRVYVRFGA